MAKRLFNEPTASPAKTPKKENLCNLQRCINDGFENLDTTLSAAGYKLARNDVDGCRGKMDKCVDLLMTIKKESSTRLDSCIRDYNSMSQRIVGLEKNTAYPRREIEFQRLKSNPDKSVSFSTTENADNVKIFDGKDPIKSTFKKNDVKKTTHEEAEEKNSDSDDALLSSIPLDIKSV